jgi:DNA mismatch repair ATPase MutL
MLASRRSFSSFVSERALAAVPSTTGFRAEALRSAARDAGVPVTSARTTNCSHDKQIVMIGAK